MRVATLLLPILLSSPFSFGQKNGEFKIHSNGLIYSDGTMDQLEAIVDSLNYKFETCDLHRTYKGKAQTKAHFLHYKGDRIESLKKELEKGVPLKEVREEYPECTIKRELLVVKYPYSTREDEPGVRYKSVLGQQRVEVEGGSGLYKRPVEGRWRIDHWEGGEYTDERIKAFYFPEPFEKTVLPKEYARKVQYADCVIDTSTGIYKEGAVRRGGYSEGETPSEIQRFMRYVHRKTERPDKKEDEDYEAFNERYQHWDSTRFEILDELSGTSRFQRKLEAAVEEAMDEVGSTEEFEEYVERYYGKEEVLELKRSRIVVGMCSMDQSPRRHAVEIAELSAETVHWETFLRAHLNIMNDRFHRVSDGSYAWEGRKTYIKELEELELDIPDLMLGISLQLENPSQNHYYGNIRRLGRALSESEHRDEMEAEMLGMIKDEALDTYNRIAVHYLFRNYNHRLEDEQEQKENQERLKEAIATLPPYVEERIELGE